MAPKPDRLAADLFAKATTKLVLATTIAAFWLTGAARAAALQACNRLAARYPIHEWGNTQIHLYRSCMARHGQPE
jgi:predicted LPLAT superfamily acyltransferase